MLISEALNAIIDVLHKLFSEFLIVLPLLVLGLSMRFECQHVSLETYFDQTGSISIKGYLLHVVTVYG